MDSLRDLLDRNDTESVRQQLSMLGIPDIQRELSALDPTDRAIAFRLLVRDRALEVFEDMDPPIQAELIHALRDDTVVQLFEQMDPDDRVQLLDEMPASVAKRLISGLSSAERAITSVLLGYPDDSAGRIMSPEYVSLVQTMTAGDAISRIRARGPSAETVYALPVIDQSRTLVGVTGLRKLVLANPETPIGEFMTRDVVFARATDDQEDAARQIHDHGLLALPVCDSENRLVGMITVDDAMHVLEEEHSEDIARSGASEPLRRPYFGASVFGLARSRAVWLLLLGIAGSATVNVLHSFESVLDQIVSLALFVPLVIGVGGNAGAQSATTVVRAMALGDVSIRDLGRVMFRELRVGIILGVSLAAVAFLPVSFLFRPGLAATVSLTLVAVCFVASIVGGGLPLVLKRLRFDPAIAGAPVLSTLIDAVGLLIYLSIAQLVLR